MTAPADLYLLRPSMSGGGADRVTLTLLRELPRERYRPTLILLRATGEFLAELPEDVRVHSLEAGSSLTGWWPLARLLRRRPPRVLFSTSSGTNLIAVLASRLARRRMRVVLSERNLLRRPRSPKRRLATALKRWAYPRADLVTAVSAGVRDDLVRELGMPRESIAVVYNPVVTSGLEGEASESVDHPWLSDTVPVVLAAGRLVAQKDHATLIRAFARARSAHEARLLILGEGPLRETLETLAREMGVAHDVSLLGFDRNPFKFMARCAVFVSSSLWEGLPGSLIQAMACGAAVLSTDCRGGGPAEVVTSGEDGVLVPAADVEALSTELCRLLADAGERRRLAANARRAARRFSVEAVLGNYVAAIEGSTP